MMVEGPGGNLTMSTNRIGQIDIAAPEIVSSVPIPAFAGVRARPWSALVRVWVGGTMVDFGELVQVESQGLVAAATAIVGDRHRAEEIVQTALERCYRRWSRVSQLDRPGAWVRRVVVNEAISVGRRSTSEHRANQRLGAMVGASFGSAADPFEASDDEDLWAAVRALPGDQAAAIALRYGADLGLDDIAEALRVTVPAVKSLLHRARTTLRASSEVQSYAEEGRPS